MFLILTTLYIFGMPLLAIIATLSVAHSDLTRARKTPWVVALWLLVVVEPLPVAFWLRHQRRIGA